ncbi:uncharacterized protein LOC110455401 [Mizuhopecten yessoensis]|uniref:uncharacterized protein LOC110455401 n=1 Tax=Mizuhopecten yessoensis TaxID=6573 RepID=UPI000B45C24D|nr:uncharacterized protein LOC110455401 [Mizuhopecten yessoensis]XP_021361191.1 uncharacterized protein LOC110455401 [Mizuhopecten yessoensis]
MTSDSTEIGKRKTHSAESKPTQPPIHKYISPAEFKMRVLRKLTSVDNGKDNKSLTNFQRQDSDRTLKASIVFPNGDVGTLISYEKMDSTKPVVVERELPNIDTELEVRATTRRQERPLRLPPIMLPPIYSTKPLPMLTRDFSLPVEPPTPLSDDDWDELQDCRYLRLYSPRKYRSNSIPA